MNIIVKNLIYFVNQIQMADNYKTNKNRDG